MNTGSVIAKRRDRARCRTRLEAILRLQHLTAINAEAKGVRLGCEFKRSEGDSLRILQRFID